MIDTTTHGQNQKPPYVDLSDWRPIDGAPKDGSWIAIRSGVWEPTAAYWDSELDAWQSLADLERKDIGYDHWPVDLWMPIPNKLKEET
tara:strand:- start:65 stop:328 length:264 start_codon:yes stop_codon:yes gene_type:complete